MAYRKKGKEVPKHIAIFQLWLSFDVPSHQGGVQFKSYGGFLGGKFPLFLPKTSTTVVGNLREASYPLKMVITDGWILTFIACLSCIRVITLNP